MIDFHIILNVWIALGAWAVLGFGFTYIANKVSGSVKGVSAEVEAELYKVLAEIKAKVQSKPPTGS